MYSSTESYCAQPARRLASYQLMAARAPIYTPTSAKRGQQRRRRSGEAMRSRTSFQSVRLSVEKGECTHCTPVVF